MITDFLKQMYQNFHMSKKMFFLSNWWFCDISIMKRSKWWVYAQTYRPICTPASWLPHLHPEGQRPSPYIRVLWEGAERGPTMWFPHSSWGTLFESTTFASSQLYVLWWDSISVVGGKAPLSDLPFNSWKSQRQINACWWVFFGPGYLKSRIAILLRRWST